MEITYELNTASKICIQSKLGMQECALGSGESLAKQSLGFPRCATPDSCRVYKKIIAQND